MSTYIHLVCLDHNPPLVAEMESGQHLDDLPSVRADLANRDALVARHDGPGINQYVNDYAEYYRHNTAAFLAAHRTCRIGIVDECGVEHSVEEPTP